MREPTAFGIEKPFPWALVGMIAAIPAGLVVAAGIVWGCLCRGWLVDTSAPL